MIEKLKKTALVLGALSPLAIFAEDSQSAIPDIGVNMSTYIGELGTKLGVTLGAALGLAVAIWLVYMGWRLYKRIAK